MQKQTRTEYIEHILANLPSKPGVYQMKDEKGKTIYVGKAVKLRNRVRSYFRNLKKQNTKTKKLVENIADIEYTVVNSNLEAIMLETNLIKILRPKYNIAMKDDKNFVYVKITVNEDFPRILITRTVQKDGARYFGPKTAKYKVQRTLKVLKRIFPFRHCSLAIEYKMPKENSTHPKKKHIVKVTKAGIKYPCIDYHIRRCIGPCVGTVDVKEYRQIIDQVISFLEGKHEQVIERLKQEMAEAAAQKKFEIAASLRDKLQSIKDIMEKQDISSPDLANQDVVNYILREKQAFFNLFQVRGGKLINQENFELLLSDLQKEGKEGDKDPDALEAFLKQYYEKATNLPDELIVPHEFDSQEIVQEWLSQMHHKKVDLTVPQRGHKQKILKLSLENAQNFAKLSKTKWEGHRKKGRDEALEKLAELLNLEKPPRRLECYDISHIGGRRTVGSMVVFEKGFPSKKDYRKFKLQQETPGEPNDFASMEETLTRRLKYLKPSSGPSLKILKAKKKEVAEILQQPELQELQQKEPQLETLPEHQTCYTINDDKNAIGWFRVDTKESSKPMVLNLQPKMLEPATEAPRLLKKIASKIKTKRLYIAAPNKSTKPFIEAGCQQVNTKNTTLEVPENQTLLVFDRNKYSDDKSFSQKPDLLIIDGGKGQLSSALKAMRKYDLKLPIVALAKKNEELYLPGKSTPIILSKTSDALHLVQHIRDEAHRFAVTYQTGLSLKASTKSALDQIPGIGDKTRQKLLQHFGSLENIKTATMYELQQVVGKKNAITIKEQLK